MNYRELCLASAVIVSGLVTLSAFGQPHTPTSQSIDDSQVRQMLLEQPDYAAIRQFVFSESKGGFGATSKVAKLGRRFREDDGDTIFIREDGKPTIKIYPKRRRFAEIPPDNRVKEHEDFAVTPAQLASRRDVDFKFIGKEKVGSYECRKVEAQYRDERLKDVKFVFCLAPELKNLLILEQSLLGSVTLTTVLSDVSLSVSPRLFQIPAGYRKIREKSYEEETQELIDLIRPGSRSRKPRE